VDKGAHFHRCDFQVLQFLEQAAVLIANAIACVCFVLLILAVVRDWRRRTPRGRMQWVGVVTALVSMMISADWIVAPPVRLVATRETHDAPL
jgi:EamA domain-containing membrane protein RarD